MAVKVTHDHTCDDCEHDRLYDVSAPHQHVLSINGGPFKQLDFCSPSDRVVMSRLIELYEERGRELTPEPKEQPAPPAKAKRRKPVAARKPKAIPAPAQAPEEQKHQEEKEDDKPPEAKKRLTIWCPEPHKSKGDRGMRVAYEDRNSHADMCHDGAKLWDISWEDPDGIITAYCTSHAECMKAGIGFTSETGLRIHVRTSPLSRIDQPIDEGPSEQPDGS